MIEFPVERNESSERKRLVSGLAYHLKALLTDHASGGVIPNSMQQVRLSMEIIRKIPVPSNKKLANCLSEINDLLKTIHSPSGMNDEFYRKTSDFLKELEAQHVRLA